jgi:hypothetical protein
LEPGYQAVQQVWPNNPLHHFKEAHTEKVQTSEDMDQLLGDIQSSVKEEFYQGKTNSAPQVSLHIFAEHAENQRGELELLTRYDSPLIINPGNPLYEQFRMDLQNIQKRHLLAIDPDSTVRIIYPPPQWGLQISVGSGQPDYMIFHELGHVFQFSELLSILSPEDFSWILSLDNPTFEIQGHNIIFNALEVPVHLEMVAPWVGKEPFEGFLGRLKHMGALLVFYAIRFDQISEVNRTLRRRIERIDRSPEVKRFAQRISSIFFSQELRESLHTARLHFNEFLRKNPNDFVMFMYEAKDPEALRVVPAAWKLLANQSSERIPEVGRNEQCPCGSGKKYKNCHGANR